jgi:uncharacterized protein YxjI
MQDETYGGAHPPDWYPDPMGRHEYRWYDGSQWTEQVSSHGRQSTDALDTAAKTVAVPKPPEKVQRQVAKHQQNVAKRGAPGGAPSFEGTGELLNEPLLVINQKVKLLEVNTEYAIYGADGQQIGAVRQVGQSKVKKVVRFLGNLDQYFTHKYQAVDRNGIVQLALTRPAKIFKSRVIVQDAAGNGVGQIVQKNVFGKIRFSFEAPSGEVGGIQAENWRAWNFSIQNEEGREVARITKTFEGVLKTMFTSADNYVLQVHEPLPNPLRQFVYASAVSIDTALKQDARGLGSGSIGDFFGG